jgi:hypothetical protein
VTLPNYNAISFNSKEEHQAALYGACLLIVNTYNQTDILDFYSLDVGKSELVSAYDFMRFARNIVNNISERME